VAGQSVPSMPLEEIVNGLRLAVATALATGRDISKGAGAVS
jgi:pyroglutamyl-peptidase